MEVDSRIGIVTWDGRPEHAFATVKWQDDGTESETIGAEKIRLKTKVHTYT